MNVVATSDVSLANWYSPVMKTWQRWTTGTSIVVLAMAVGTGIAFATIPDSSGVIHACYQSPPPAHGANLQVIDTGNGGSCGGGMTQVTWNQVGLQGPAGPPGASTAGAAGLDVIFVRATNGPPPVLVGTATALCPADHPYVLGGGGDAASHQSPVKFSGPVSGGGEPVTGPESTRTDLPNGWQVGLADQSVVAFAWAICAK